MRPRGSVPEDVRPRLPLKLARRARIAVIRSDYHREMTERLQSKCIETLIHAGVPPENILQVAVPGCFEIPLAARRLAARREYHALIALGVVIRGDTHHFDLVANECARGVMQVSLEHDIPIIFEVLATYNRRDAARRAANDSSNKGIEAANSALSLLAALGGIGGGR
jgi:6,7-dimethyl-8-ribityllumazine synthase